MIEFKSAKKAWYAVVTTLRLWTALNKVTDSNPRQKIYRPFGKGTILSHVNVLVHYPY
ncbi:hypothetical protein [Prevotella sp. HUN102]|uniref:hypothetical protein n=1 Tax=Prevotella sp. HUN102 TaxID=1392486 RepID=UPI0012DFB5F9|nr:hypothetical protein [Prevotella sp. HUN102]